jgi:hypothetical protein
MIPSKGRMGEKGVKGLCQGDQGYIKVFHMD